MWLFSSNYSQLLDHFITIKLKKLKKKLIAINLKFDSFSRLITIFCFIFTLGYSFHNHKFHQYHKYPRQYLFKYQNECALIITRRKTYLHNSVNYSSDFQSKYANYIPRSVQVFKFKPLTL